MPRTNADGDRVASTTNRDRRPSDPSTVRRARRGGDGGTDDEGDEDDTTTPDPSTVRRARRGGDGGTDDDTPGGDPDGNAAQRRSAAEARADQLAEDPDAAVGAPADTTTTDERPARGGIGGPVVIGGVADGATDAAGDVVETVATSEEADRVREGDLVGAVDTSLETIERAQPEATRGAVGTTRDVVVGASERAGTVGREAGEAGREVADSGDEVAAAADVIAGDTDERVGRLARGDVSGAVEGVERTDQPTVSDDGTALDRATTGGVLTETEEQTIAEAGEEVERDTDALLDVPAAIRGTAATDEDVRLRREAADAGADIARAPFGLVRVGETTVELAGNLDADEVAAAGGTAAVAGGLATAGRSTAERAATRAAADPSGAAAGLAGGLIAGGVAGRAASTGLRATTGRSLPDPGGRVARAALDRTQSGLNRARDAVSRSPDPERSRAGAEDALDAADADRVSARSGLNLRTLDRDRSGELRLSGRQDAPDETVEVADQRALSDQPTRAMDMDQATRGRTLGRRGEPDEPTVGSRGRRDQLGQRAAAERMRRGDNVPDDDLRDVAAAEQRLRLRSREPDQDFRDATTPEDLRRRRTPPGAREDTSLPSAGRVGGLLGGATAVREAAERSAVGAGTGAGARGPPQFEPLGGLGGLSGPPQFAPLGDTDSVSSGTIAPVDTGTRSGSVSGTGPQFRSFAGSDVDTGVDQPVTTPPRTGTPTDTDQPQAPRSPDPDTTTPPRVLTRFAGRRGDNDRPRDRDGRGGFPGGSGSAAEFGGGVGYSSTFGTGFVSPDEALDDVL
jgi:hypothetical protein